MTKGEKIFTACLSVACLSVVQGLFDYYTPALTERPTYSSLQLPLFLTSIPYTRIEKRRGKKRSVAAEREVKATSGSVDECRKTGTLRVVKAAQDKRKVYLGKKAVSDCGRMGSIDERKNGKVEGAEMNGS